MSTQEKARALMNRQQHSVKHRQKSMLGRAAAEVGLTNHGDATGHENQN